MGNPLADAHTTDDEAGKMPKQEPVTIQQLKVVLKDIKPPIWRRLLVRSDTRLHQFHAILQVAMGWMDGHLHAFTIGESLTTRAIST